MLQHWNTNDAKNIKLLYLPPYCPQLNLQEIWENKFFTNLVLISIDAVMDKLEEATIFYAKNEEIVNLRTGFDWLLLCLDWQPWYEILSVFWHFAAGINPYRPILARMWSAILCKIIHIG